MASAALARLAERLGARCREAGLTVATAESCTGGLVADALTDVPGSSDWYVGGVVSYSNALKVSQLGVDGGLLAAHGAVSEEVARAMAIGARTRLGADIAVSVTGIAGPTGGTAEKPVGRVWIACATVDGVTTQMHTWQGDRVQNKRLSAEAALGTLLGAT